MCSFLTFWKLKKIIPDFHFLKDFGCPNSKNKTQNNDQYISLSEVHLSFFWNVFQNGINYSDILKKKAKYYSNICIKYIHICMCDHFVDTLSPFK